jgi:steroid 5-alpha reductase family enzyme
MMLFAFDQYNILGTLVASFVIQGLFFAFASTFMTDKLTDISYSLGFIFLTGFLMIANGAYSYGQIAAASFVILWAARLGAYLLTRILKIGKDARFDDKRENFVRFLSFWTLQAFAVWVIMLPITVILGLPSVADPTGLSLIGALIWALGFAVEIISDAQKFAFRNKPANHDRWIQAGLWRYSRHPNYFGETLVWWGIFLYALPYLKGLLLLTIVGPISITLLLLFVSGIPLLEKSAESKYGTNPEYKDYKRRTSLFFILPPRKDKA